MDMVFEVIYLILKIIVFLKDFLYFYIMKNNINIFNVWFLIFIWVFFVCIYIGKICNKMVCGILIIVCII